jgi:dihydroorotate dehydrogenase
LIPGAVPIPYSLARSALFRLPAETAHELAVDCLEHLPYPVRAAIRHSTRVDDPRLETWLWNIAFPNPVGLAAGFDKSARSFNALGALGFGFVEVGTITALPQPGNPKPRLFRLPADEALLNRMGFNNPGAEAVAQRLAGMRPETILGVNVGKSKVTPLEGAIDDYLRSISLLAPFARYLVINVSSPNTPGLRDLQDAGPLRALLRAVSAELARTEAPPPVLLKLAPDLTDPQLDQAVAIAAEERAAGIVAVNTTISREGLRTPAAEVERLGAGGISGRPVRSRAQEVVARIRRTTEGRMPIIGVGGIFSATDAWDRICAGANLVQLYTGFVYGGPAIVKRINLGIAERLDRTGARSIAEVVGSQSR